MYELNEYINKKEIEDRRQLMEEHVKVGYFKCIGRIYSTYLKGKNTFVCVGTGTIIKFCNNRFAIGVSCAHNFLINIPEEEIMDYADKKKLWFSIEGIGTFKIKDYFIKKEYENVE